MNLKYNPVAKELLYHTKMQENLPKIETLDEEEVVGDFFEKQNEQSKRSNMKKNISKSKNNKFSEIKILKMLFEMGLKEELVERICGEAIDNINTDMGEEELLVQHIKNYNKEQKANLSY